MTELEAEQVIALRRIADALERLIEMVEEERQRGNLEEE